ncbi:CarD family transcriptional regulator [Aneurinibacillus migulanus]|uniref:Transcriptional regulator, CarD family n=2 Tax=Aneurinibacillus migulanus TaxID=47500 RepID=A0A1G8Y4C8_ANEMI|nr:CarD family transcriptional regulator [Aneurinibacillus migulanus]KIV57383.1 transcription factor YdeB [Aneurinibacillus migulanus]KIV57750.1 transcription factor YdeB [Aneurinibacillus migulanus]MCP1358049.1 transcription factor YdeB [Aneurinibacillus migulanus]MED0896408.1 CarD family transcriptional regulator [Aneurinibacillus migulanus]MED1616067.1 CarD family transcriptional regulator [Aneurinibacillus migulanus]
MFEIGDKVVYPMHGAGVIEAIEEKEILGKKQRYYIIEMPIGNMQVMVPMDKASNLGIRPAVDMSTLENALRIFQHEEWDRSLPWSQRYRINMDKMKTGNLQEGMEVIRDLLHRNKEKILNTSEKKLLDDARKFVISELALVKGCTKNQAIDLLDQETHKAEMID